MSIFKYPFFALLLAAGCGAAPGTRPHDMSVAGHQSAARALETEAATHETRSDPGGSVALGSCGASSSGGSSCWATLRRAHEDEAGRLERLAAEHREAARTLAAEEQRSCGDLVEADRAQSPLLPRERVVSVVPVNQLVRTGKATQEKLAGATIALRPSPGLTAERLQQLVSCHIAHMASLGHGITTMNDCPLALQGVIGVVSSVGDGFAVAVSSDNDATAREILRRAQALALP